MAHPVLRTKKPLGALSEELRQGKQCRKQKVTLPELKSSLKIRIAGYDMLAFF